MVLQGVATSRDVLHVRASCRCCGPRPARAAARDCSPTAFGGDETIRQVVVIGEEPGILVARRDDDGAGQVSQERP